MAQETSMPTLIEVLVRLKQNHAIKRIYRELGVHPSVTRKMKRLAHDRAWLCPDTAMPAEKELYDAFYGSQASGLPVHPLDKHRDILERYQEEGLSYEAMHRNIQEYYRCSESQVRRYVKSRLGETKRVVVKRLAEMGVLEIDFGTLGKAYDPHTNSMRTVKLFSARLRHSRKAYRAIVLDETFATFGEHHMRAFEYFGGVPEKTVPDNTKAAVIKAAWHDAVVNRQYRELALHYGFLIDQCLPYKPQHKGGVENDVKYVKSSFFLPFMVKQAEHGRIRVTVDDIREGLRVWEATVCDVRLISGVGRSPNDLFTEEQMHLKELPLERWDTVEWRECTVGQNQRIAVDTVTYMMPERYIGEKVQVAVNSKDIRVFYRHDLITIHVRSYKRYDDVMKPEYYGERYRKYLEMNHSNLCRRALAVGAATYKVIDTLCKDKAQVRLHDAYGILNFVKKYSAQRLERACMRAVFYENPGYGTIKRILEKNLDLLPIEEALTSHGQRVFRFQRENIFN